MVALTTAALIAAVLIPAVVGATLAVTGARIERAAVPVGLGAAAVTVIAGAVAAGWHARLTVPFLGVGVPGSDAGFRVDPLAALVLPVVTAVGFLVLLFAATDRTSPTARFHGLMLLFIAAVVVTVTTTTLPALLAAWEVMGATSYALIGFHWQHWPRVRAGFVAFLVTRTGDLGLYLAAGAAIAAGTGWDLGALAEASGPWQQVIAAGLLAAGLGKAAQLPFSFWISRAMEGPSPVSALLHSAAMVAMGGYLLLRTEPVLFNTSWAGPAAAWIGAATAIVLGVIALAQRDLKQVLAASTASQLGFVFVAAGSGSVSGGAMQLIAHAATKALLFVVAGAWLTATGTKQLSGLRGVARRWPVVGVLMTVGAASLAGLPPLSLWYGKDRVLAAAREVSPALYVAGLVAAALAAAYSARILVLLWRPAGDPESSWDDEQPGTRRVPSVGVVPMVVLAAAAASLGLLAIPPLRRLLDDLNGPAPSGLELAASAVLAAIIAVIVLWRPPTLRFGRGWFGMERVATVVIARPILVLADLLATGDAHAARWVDGSGPALLRVARAARVLDDRGFAAAVGRIGSALAFLGRAARRPQTGLIQHYYIGGTVILGAAIILLVVVR